jgi:hypothetical protein
VRLAVITAKQVRVFDGRRCIAAYDYNPRVPLTAEEVESVRLAAEDPPPPKEAA